MRRGIAPFPTPLTYRFVAWLLRVRPTKVWLRPRLYFQLLAENDYFTMPSTHVLMVCDVPVLMKGSDDRQ